MDHTAFEALEKWAADDFRSVNGQLEWIIAQALRDAKRMPKSKVKPSTAEEKEEIPPEKPEEV